jgi:hypothetical protein
MWRRGRSFSLGRPPRIHPSRSMPRFCRDLGSW